MPQLDTVEHLKEASIPIQTEASSLNPSTLITLFEIDLSELAKDQNVPQQDINSQEYRTIFRFHNQVKAFHGSSIIWSGNDGNEKTYIAAPIQAVGFEYNAKGTLATPKLSITVNEENILYLNVLKQRMLEYKDLVGAKVTRIRTFWKFVDSKNFGPGKTNPTADWTREFPRDIFYIDRKTAENKYAVEFELASVMDVEGLMLPQRLCLSRCPFQYRGDGCCYETGYNRTFVHGSAAMPAFAPPVATANDELITKAIGSETLVDKGKYNRGTVYTKGDYVYIEKDGVKYYYVSKIIGNNHAPPNATYWVEDTCSKSLTGCKLRWQRFSLDADKKKRLPQRDPIPFNVLPFGGFPSVAKYGFNLY